MEFSDRGQESPGEPLSRPVCLLLPNTKSLSSRGLAGKLPLHLFHIFNFYFKVLLPSFALRHWPD